MSEPYRDPDGPIHAVLAAADAAEPRVRLVGDGALIHARYEAPSGRCGESEATADAEGRETFRAMERARFTRWLRELRRS